MKLTDIILTGLAALFLSPVVIIATLLYSGVIHLNAELDNEDAKGMSEFLQKYNPYQDSANAEQSKVFAAAKVGQTKLESERKQISLDIERLESLKDDNQALKTQIENERKKIETLVGENRELSDERLNQLAEVYGSMKPIESAPILLSLENKTVSKIIEKIPDIRAKAKIMAAMGAMDNARAAEITKLLGWRNGTPK
tara:strand:+ start:535 stop:1128 length:594 start_codon:yes stop_codon:yes gene_type:complete